MLDTLTEDSGSYLNEVRTVSYFTKPPKILNFVKRQGSLYERDYKKSYFGSHHPKLKTIKEKYHLPLCSRWLLEWAWTSGMQSCAVASNTMVPLYSSTTSSTNSGASPNLTTLAGANALVCNVVWISLEEDYRRIFFSFPTYINPYACYLNATLNMPCNQGNIPPIGVNIRKGQRMLRLRSTLLIKRISDTLSRIRATTISVRALPEEASCFGPIISRIWRIMRDSFRKELRRLRRTRV